tara:strand:+ start:62 stop:223 length:162 start_codon:yes stop_codon:yes gene_type:complete
MAKNKLIGKLVRLKSGRVGIVTEVNKISKTLFLSILLSGSGVINMRAEDVEVL